MPDENDEITAALGRELVSRLAPEELPLYPSLMRQSQGNKRGGRRKASSGDQILGFGAAEAVTMLTPVILSFSRGFWDALVAQAAQDSLHGMLAFVRARLHGHHQAGAEPPPLTAGQIQLVRTVAEREARRLKISGGQAELLADAVVGVLAAPGVS